LVDDSGTNVCRIYWNCPWGTKTNTFTVDKNNNDYDVQATGANPDRGAIGTVTVKVASLL
jgi:hypothetical protein